MKKLIPGWSVATCFAVLFIIACTRDVNTDETEKPQRLGTNLMMDKSLFTTSQKERNSSNVFEIKEITRKNETLEVTVKGGGSAESFQFLWNGLILESFPMGIHLLLKYDNSNNDFDPNKEISISLNLQKILGDKYNLKNFYFNLINGSKVQTAILNPNGGTTIENK